MPKKKEQSIEEVQYEDFKRELESHFAGTVVNALMARDDVAAVFIPATMHMKAPRGAVVITLKDGTSVKGRFVVDEAFASQ